MRIGIVNNSKHQTPIYKTPGSSGVDICANIEEDILLKWVLYFNTGSLNIEKRNNWIVSLIKRKKNKRNF